MRAALAEDQARLNVAVEGRQQMERRLAEAERALVAAVKAIADRREGLAKLIGQVNAMRTRSAAAADEIARLDGVVRRGAGRAEEAQEQYEMAAAGSIRGATGAML